MRLIRETLASPAASSPTIGDDTRLLHPQSGWHSPIPYLFGGLAAMMGLIAFALLILACSYWKLSGHLDSGESESGGEVEKEAGGGPGETKAVWESKVLVIMAGQVVPTFLATPSTSRSSSFGCDECGGQKGKRVVEDGAQQEHSTGVGHKDGDGGVSC